MECRAGYGHHLLRDLPNSLTIYNVTAAGQPADGQTTGLYDTDKLNVYG